MTNLYRLWRGELALANAFWNWAVFGGLLINVASSALFLFLIMNDRPVSAFIAGYAPTIPYNISPPLAYGGPPDTTRVNVTGLILRGP